MEKNLGTNAFLIPHVWNGMALFVKPLRPRTSALGDMDWKEKDRL